MPKVSPHSSVDGALQQLLDQLPAVWRASSLSQQGRCATGFAALDVALGGGWPVAGLIELQCAQPGIGELQVLWPLLRQLHRNSLLAAAQGRSHGHGHQDHVLAQTSPVIWVNPPFEPHAMALSQAGVGPRQRHHWRLSVGGVDAVWVTEQLVRSGGCLVLLVWLGRLSMQASRRLQLAASTARTLVIWFAPLGRTLSAAVLRAQLQPVQQSGQRPLQQPVQQPVPRSAHCEFTQPEFRHSASGQQGLWIDVIKVRGQRPMRVMLSAAQLASVMVP